MLASRNKRPLASFIVLLLIVSMFYGLPLPSAAADAAGDPVQEELLPNGGFETVTNGFPDYWDLYNAGFPLSVSTELVYEGQYSLKLTDPSLAAQVGVRSAKAPVVPGKAYRVSVFANVYAQSGGPDLYLEFWDSAGARIKVDTKTAAPLNEWQQLKIQQEAPPNAVYATLLLYGSTAFEGIAYFDQAALNEIPLAELHQMMNNGFEEVAGGTPANWSQLTPTVPAVSSSEYVYEGSRSVKLANPNNYAMGLRSSFVPVTPGLNYKLSVQNYIVNGTPEIYFEFWNGSGQRIGVYIQSGQKRSQWQNLVVEAEAPPGAAYATILLLSNYAGTSYFDMASIEQIPMEPVQQFPLQESAHPRLYFTSADIPALKAKAQDTAANPFGPTGQQLWNDVKAMADVYLAETDHYTINYGGGTIVDFALPPVQPGYIPPPPGYTSYPSWTQMSREIQNRLETLSLAYVITDDSDFADKAKSYVLSMTTWNNWTDLTDECGGACLDTVHITMGMSAAYDMLYGLFTPAERSQIEAALDEKGLKPLYTNTLPKIDNNGPIVKTSALAIGASVLHGSNPNTNKYLTRASNYMGWYLDQRMQSGQNEGFLYTDYSIETLVTAVDQMTRTTGQNSLITHPFFNDFVVRWSSYFLAPDGTGMAAFSDSMANSYFHDTMHVLNNWLDNGYAGWFLSEAKPVSLNVIHNFLYFDPNGQVTSPSGLETSAVFPEIGWAAFRSGWEKEDTLLAFQSNNFSIGHNHYDQNSFQVATNGSWIARDPGYQDFRPGAYNDFTVRMGHSTIQVDGQGQTSLGGGTLTPGMITPAYDYVKGSAAGAYANPKLEKFDRHIVYVKPDYYVMLDDLQADAPRNFDWVMFNGPLFDYRVDGISATPGQTLYGNDLYVQNGSGQISAKFLSPEALPMTIAEYSGAEKYGYSVKVRSGDQKQTDYKFLTVMKAGPLEHTGYYQAEELLPAMTVTASSYNVRTEVGTRFVQFNASQAGSYVSYQINVDHEGDYRFATTFVDHINYGNVQAYVDGQPVGTVFTAGDFGFKPSTPQKHGTVHLTAGTHTLRYEAVGKNPDAAGYSFSIDAIQLAPVGEVIDADMQIDAELLQGANAIGALIERGDGSSITDAVLFKTGGSSYALGGVGSDAEQTVVSRADSGWYSGYAMTRGTTLAHNGNVLLQGASAFNAAMQYDEQTALLKGTVELSAPMQVTLHAASVSQVKVDGNVLNANEYSYDAVGKTLTVSLAAGAHEIEVSDLSGMMNAYKASGDLSHPLSKQLENSFAQALHQLGKGSAVKAIKHMNDYLKHLNNPAMQRYVSAAAKAVLSVNADRLIASWSAS